MKTSLFLRGLLALIVTVALVNCDDHRIPAVTPGSPPEHLRVKTITQELTELAGRAVPVKKVSVFNYDAQGRLGSIHTYESPDSMAAPAENSVYTYDGQNRLTQMRREIVSRTGSDPNPYEIYSYTYNVAGQVSKLDYHNHKDGEDHNTWALTFQYTPGNLMQSSYKSFFFPPVTYTENSEYTFTGKNVTEIVTTSKLSRAPTGGTPETTTTTFTFDTKINPFYGVFVIPAPTGGFSGAESGNLAYYTYYGGIDNVFNLSQNNVLSSVSPTRTITYAYTYVGNLPATRIKTEPFNPQETLTYEYESY